MATTEELKTGLEMLMNEARRLGARFSDAQWANDAHEDGWTNKELLAHVAAVGTMTIPFATAMLAAPPGAGGPGEGLDYNAINAQTVAQRKDKTPAELIDEVATAYGGVMRWLEGADGAAMERRVTALMYRDLTMSDLMMQMLVLHGLAHIYTIGAHM